MLNFRTAIGGSAADTLVGNAAGNILVGGAGKDTLVAGSAEIRAPLTSPLGIAKAGISVFLDIATIYDKGQRLADQHFSRGFGGGVWFVATVIRLNLVVAHGVGGGTRVHFGTSVTF